MKQKAKLFLFWAAGAFLSIAVLCGFRCPAQGCPACKMMGK